MSEILLLWSIKDPKDVFGYAFEDIARVNRIKKKKFFKKKKFNVTVKTNQNEKNENPSFSGGFQGSDSFFLFIKLKMSLQF